VTKKTLAKKIDEKKILAFTRKLKAMSQATDRLYRLFIKSLPEELVSHGSDLWWEREHVLAKEDIEAGRVRSYDDIEDLIADLHKAVEENEKKNYQNQEISASIPQFA